MSQPNTTLFAATVSNADGPKLLREREVADMLGYKNPNSLANLRKRGVLEEWKLPWLRLATGRVRYKRDDVLKFMRRWAKRAKSSPKG